MSKVETLTTDEAIASIVAKMKVLRADEDDSNEGKYEMFAEKLVFEVLTYCNREEFLYHINMSHDIRDIMTAMVMIKNACTSLSKYTNCTKCPLFNGDTCTMINRGEPTEYNWLDGIQL